MNTARLDTDAEYLPAGTPVYVDLATRVAEVCKSTYAVDTGTATTLKVPQGHHFQVGDAVTDFTQNRVITGITASGDIDIFTLPSGLVTTTTGTVYGEAAGSGAYSSIKEKYLPNGLIKDITRIKEGNADAPVVKIGTAREDALAFPLPSSYKIALREAL